MCLSGLAIIVVPVSSSSSSSNVDITVGVRAPVVCGNSMCLILHGHDS